MSVDYTPWADSGSLESDSTFTETAIETGFLAERLPASRLNRILHRADAAINELTLRGGLRTDGDTPRQRETEQIWSDDALAIACSPRNRMANGTTAKYTRIYPTTISGVRKILACDFTATPACEIDVFDVDTMAYETSVDLSAGYGTPTGTWRPRGIVADGTWAYVVMEDSGGTYSAYVQCFRMSDWVANPAWPADGTQISNGSGSDYPHEIVFADNTSIAVMSRLANPLITLLARSDGAITDSGDGDYTAASSRYIGGLCSNGTYLFFCCDTQLCSASIADLNVGCGGAGWPLTISSVDDFVACAGPIVVQKDGNDARLVHIDGTYGDITGLLTVRGVCFDGMNFWSAAIDGSGYGCLQKIPVWGVQPTGSVIVDSSLVESLLTYYYNMSDLVTTLSGQIISDGRDIWWGGVQGDFLGTIYRLPWSRER